MRENRAALRPPADRAADAARRLAQRDASVELFGRRLDSPFLLAPVGVLELAHREADVAVARAARADRRADDLLQPGVAPDGGVRRGARRQPALVPALLEHLGRPRREPRRRAPRRAAARRSCSRSTRRSLGWRPRDLELAFLPFLRGKGIAQYTSDPVFRRLMAEGPRGGEDAAAAADAAGAAHARAAHARLSRPVLARTCARATRAPPCSASREIFSRPSLSWDDLPFLRERTKLPILLKGILHPDDARRALDAGIDGIVVSNHGGRQVDGAIATLDALPGVVEAVDGRVPVLLDSGVRGGADAFKALALGATAVLIGRALRLRARGRRRGRRARGAREPARRARPDDGAGGLRLARRGRPGDACRMSARRPPRCCSPPSRSPAAARSRSPTRRSGRR